MGGFAHGFFGRFADGLFGSFFSSFFGWHIFSSFDFIKEDLEWNSNKKLPDFWEN